MTHLKEEGAGDGYETLIPSPRSRIPAPRMALRRNGPRPDQVAVECESEPTEPPKKTAKLDILLFSHLHARFDPLQFGQALHIKDSARIHQSFGLVFLNR